MRYVATGATLLIAVSSSALADIVEYEADRDGWFAAAVPVETIGFAGFPPGTPIEEQYAALGVHFVDGSDFAFGDAFDLYPQDGAGIDGNRLVDIVFDRPIMAIGMDHPGAVQVQLISDGEVFYTSDGWSHGGHKGIGNFGGLVSTRPFDRVHIYDPSDFNVFIDDIHFGPPIPAPSALAVLLIAGAGRRARRR